MNLSFCTTACIRPELLKKTYASFNRNLKGIDLKQITLFINVDPAPAFNNDKIEDIYNTCTRYFGGVEINIPKEPNFTKAVSWCWRSADTDFIFHLEEDWLLMNVVDMQRVMKQLENNPHIVQFILRAYTYKYKKMVLSPSILKKSFYKAMCNHFNFSMNPEIQLALTGHSRNRGNDGPYLMVYPDDKIIVKDLGRSWNKRHNVSKGKVKRDFIKWVPYEISAPPRRVAPR